MSGLVPDPPAAAHAVFGDRLPLATSFAERLATDGIQRGLIGPREIPRLWERHLLNSAVVADLIPNGARIVDVGSGAGLPGLALACRRPDVQVDLVESLARRVTFLRETVALVELGDTVRVVHGRAEDQQVRATVGESQWVTARAVAPLPRLVRWCMPLLRSDGALLAIKGEQAAAEIESIRGRTELDVTVARCGGGTLDTPVTVVVVRRKSATQGGD